jgi:hypothetical protein
MARQLWRVNGEGPARGVATSREGYPMGLSRRGFERISDGGYPAACASAQAYHSFAGALGAGGLRPRKRGTSAVRPDA